MLHIKFNLVLIDIIIRIITSRKGKSTWYTITFKAKKSFFASLTNILRRVWTLSAMRSFTTLISYTSIIWTSINQNFSLITIYTVLWLTTTCETIRFTLEAFSIGIWLIFVHTSITNNLSTRIRTNLTSLRTSKTSSF